MTFLRRFFIEGRDEAERVLETVSPTHLVSFRDVGADPLRAAGRVKDRIELEFDDASSLSSLAFGYRPPELEDVRMLVEWLRERQHALRDGLVLFQCEQGLSRSPAAAVIAMRVLGASYRAAVSDVLAVRPRARPNTLMLELAERLLGS
jgi:predicted protein tyrosine phosphatase